MPRPLNLALDDAMRDALLRDLRLLDCAPARDLDAVCRTAAALFRVPIALVTLAADAQLHLRGRFGVAAETIDRDGAFCDRTVRNAAGEALVVADLAEDARFADSPLVTGAPHARFYAGVPFALADGTNLGTLCVVDTVPRPDFGPREAAQLADLCLLVETQMRQRAAASPARGVYVGADPIRRGEAERAVHRSEAHYRLLADTASDMIVRQTIDGVPTYVSPASRAVLGYAPDEMLAVALPDLVHPEDRPRIGDGLAALTAGRIEQESVTHRLRHRDGHWVWVEARLRLVRDAAGAPFEVITAARDVSARVATEDALRASEARYRALADSLPQLVWITSIHDGQAAYVNRRFEQYYGPIGPTRAARAAHNHPDDAERMEAAWETARERGTSYEVEGRLRRHDGLYRWHKLVMLPIRQTGEIVGMLGTALDIDDIVMARLQLEETTNLLLLAQESAGAGTWHLDFANAMIEWSSESARLHGIETTGKHVISARDWLSLVVKEDGLAAIAAARHAAETQTGYSVEFRVPQADGGVRWITCIGRALSDASGQATRMVGLNIDTTERKAAEQALIEAKATADVARRDAERASAAKTDFLAAMSHEIRTPLNGILGYADLLLEEPDLGPALRLHGERIQNAGAALLTVVNDILDFSKIEAGQIDLSPEPFGVSGLVENTVSIVRTVASQKGLAIRVKADPAFALRVVGDQDRLRQVLLNLLNNAIKFTRVGEVALSVSLLGTEAGMARLRFAVEDTGIGIPEAKRHLLFERFSQVDGTIQREFGGTGLGLAICKQLVELMGGEIGVTSTPGAGSAFWFTLALPVSTRTEAAKVAHAATAVRSGRRLLLVEDVPLNQDLGCAILRQSGYAVDVVDNGAEAIRAVQAERYDLVLMDVQMPGMDGITATRRIRALDHAAAAVPIIALTANVLPQQVAEFHAAGMTDHVGKPFKRDALVAVIEHWAGERAAPVAPPPRMPWVCSWSQA